MMGFNVFLFAAQFVDLLVYVLMTAMILRAILSWFVPPGSDNMLMRFLREITEPLLNPLRRIVPNMGMLDLSLFVATILLQVVGGIVAGTLRSVAY